MSRLVKPEGSFTPFHPRSHQLKMMQAFSPGADGRPAKKRGVAVWHRRAGKDTTVLGGVLMPLMAARPGNYFLVYPFFAEAKRAIWQTDSFMQMFPPQWNPCPMETELYVRMTIEGRTARLYLLGAETSDAADKLRGTNPFGVAYSEAQKMNGKVADVLLPALMENGGWELKYGTPAGKDQFYRDYLTALAHPDTHYAELLTIDDTRRDAVDLDGKPLPGEDGSPIITPEMVQEERDRGKSEEWLQQEFYSSFEGYQVGTIYGDALKRARESGRIGEFRWKPELPVGVMVDIGRTDPLAVVFYQEVGGMIWFIDYYAARGSEVGEFIGFLLSKPYRYGRITLPHDAGHERFEAGGESVEFKVRRAIQCHVKVNEKSGNKVLGIDLVRGKFGRFCFDEGACGRAPSPSLPSFLDSLGNYRYGWSDERQDNSGPPIHDQNSHAADALRTGMEGWMDGMEFEDERKRQKSMVGTFDVFGKAEDDGAVKMQERQREVLSQWGR